MMHGFPLRGITALIILSFAIGSVIGLMLNASLLATTTPLSAKDFSHILGLR
jgi:hypothetical protein